MPQQNEHLSFKSDAIVSDIDYAEARTILDLTSTKQKELRRERSPRLLPQLLLKRTYNHVCALLDSECSNNRPIPLATIDTNKRKLPTQNHELLSKAKKSKNSIENDILQFLHELNSVKVKNRY